RFHRDKPNDRERRSNLAAAYQGLGDALSQLNHLEEALSAYRKAGALEGMASTPGQETGRPQSRLAELFSSKLDRGNSAISRSGKELGQTVGSAFWLQTEKSKGLGLKGVGLRQLLECRPRGIRDDLVGVPHARRQVRQQTTKALHRQPALSLVGFLLCLGRCRRPRRLDRVTFLPVLRQFLVGVQQRCPGLPHPPLDAVSQQ